MLVAVLVAYPLVVAGLVGLVAGYASSKPRVALVDEDGLPAYVDVGDLFPPRLLGLVWHRDREQSQAARVLIKVAQEVCAEVHRSALLGTPPTGRRASTR